MPSSSILEQHETWEQAPQVQRYIKVTLLLSSTVIKLGTGHLCVKMPLVLTLMLASTHTGRPTFYTHRHTPVHTHSHTPSLFNPVVLDCIWDKHHKAWQWRIVISLQILQMLKNTQTHFKDYTELFWKQSTCIQLYSWTWAKTTLLS